MYIILYLIIKYNIIDFYQDSNQLVFNVTDPYDSQALNFVSKIADVFRCGKFPAIDIASAIDNLPRTAYEICNTRLKQEAIEESKKLSTLAKISNKSSVTNISPVANESKVVKNNETPSQQQEKSSNDSKSLSNDSKSVKNNETPSQQQEKSSNEVDKKENDNVDGEKSDDDGEKSDDDDEKSDDDGDEEMRDDQKNEIIENSLFN